MTALLSTALLGELGERVPASNRWHTFGRALDVQAFGLSLHRVLGRLSELAGCSPNALADIAQGKEDQTGETDFAAYRAKKDLKSNKFLTDPSSSILLLEAAAMCEPLDHLSARLQRLDFAGYD